MAIKGCHSLGGLNRNLLSLSSGSQKSEVELLVLLIPFEDYEGCLFQCLFLAVSTLLASSVLSVLWFLLHHQTLCFCLLTVFILCASAQVPPFYKDISHLRIETYCAPG